MIWERRHNNGLQRMPGTRHVRGSDGSARAPATAESKRLGIHYRYRGPIREEEWSHEHRSSSPILERPNDGVSDIWAGAGMVRILR